MEIAGTIKTLGAWGSIGVLVGIGLVFWVEPTSPGGVGLVLLVSVLGAMVVGAGLAAIFGKADKPNDADE